MKSLTTLFLVALSLSLFGQYPHLYIDGDNYVVSAEDTTPINYSLDTALSVYSLGWDWVETYDTSEVVVYGAGVVIDDWMTLKQHPTKIMIVNTVVDYGNWLQKETVSAKWYQCKTACFSIWTDDLRCWEEIDPDDVLVFKQRPARLDCLDFEEIDVDRHFEILSMYAEEVIEGRGLVTREDIRKASRKSTKKRRRRSGQ